MLISQKNLSGLNLSFLICGLYTLCEDGELLRKSSVKNQIYLDIKQGDDVEVLKNVIEFYKLTNKFSLRNFSASLIKSLITLNFSSSFFIIKNESLVEKNYVDEMSPYWLKKYLRKFKYNYRRYFFYQNSVYINLPTNKQMNAAAIGFLFLITGI